MDWETKREVPDAPPPGGVFNEIEPPEDPFATAIRGTRMPMLLTDPSGEDNPIIFANDAFLRLTGYDRDEVMGRNCRFLQGPETDPEAVRIVREAIAVDEEVSVDMLNYRKDGTPFWNALFISPVRGETGKTRYFFAAQMDVSGRKRDEFQAFDARTSAEAAVSERTRELEERTRDLEKALAARTALLHEVDHRVKNNLQMISSLILMQSRSIPDESIRSSLQSMLSRVEALSTVHRRLYQSDDVTAFDVGEFVHDLVTELVAATGEDRVKAELELVELEIPADKAAALGLVINELVTNALKHAFPGNETGTLRVTLSTTESDFTIEVADNGIGMKAAESGDFFGTRLVRALSAQLDADVQWHEARRGTRVVIHAPLPNRNGKNNV